MSQHFSIRLFLARTIPVTADWEGKNRRSTFWRLYFNDGPGVSVKSQGVVYRIEPQRLFLIPARCVFDIALKTQVSIPTRHFALHFDIPGLPGFRLRTVQSVPFQLPVNASLEAIAQGYCEKCGPHDWQLGEDGDLEHQLSLQCLVFGALSAMWGALPREKRQRSENFDAAHGAILPALRFIENHPGDKISNEQLAAMCHLSRGHFIRCFKEATGHPPMTYLVEWRIALAAQKLLSSGDTIETIAAELGFGNRFYFSRMFKQQVGLSPAAFRRDGTR